MPQIDQLPTAPPAWNDDNLRSVSEQIRSALFFAHVRASTGTATSRANCHPFRHGRWLFMHNGAIGGFEDIRREIDLMIPAALYRHRSGTTDSEALFLLLLANGLETDPAAAFATTMAAIVGTMAAAGIAAPLRVTAAATDGEEIVALRYASDRQSPTLYYGHTEFDGGAQGQGAILVLSEPLDSNPGHWVEVPDSHLLVAGDGAVAIEPFAPA
ncbi:MAG: class II glutamine amidotransferase [Alphaproteobacteria bacterium]|nr:class II glutamine amidotransferase [Alphaproteobacteria bacterium]